MALEASGTCLWSCRLIWVGVGVGFPVDPIRCTLGGSSRQQTPPQAMLAITGPDRDRQSHHQDKRTHQHFRQHDKRNGMSREKQTTEIELYRRPSKRDGQRPNHHRREERHGGAPTPRTPVGGFARFSFIRQRYVYQNGGLRRLHRTPFHRRQFRRPCAALRSPYRRLPS
jgi:hypothetical protein